MVLPLVVLTTVLFIAAGFFAVAVTQTDWRGVILGSFIVAGLMSFAVKWLAIAVEVSLRSLGMWPLMWP